MTIRFLSRTTLRATAFAVLAAVAGAGLSISTAGSARADQWRHDGYYHHYYHHRYWGPRAYYGYAPPPVVYGPPVYYAPPPVVYAPPPVAYGPSLNVVVPIR